MTQETDTTEPKKETGDAVAEKKSKRSEQKEQGKQVKKSRLTLTNPNHSNFVGF